MTFTKKRFIFEVKDGEVNVPSNFYKFSRFLMDYMEMFVVESDEDRLAYQQSLIITHNSFTICNEIQPENIEYIRLKVIDAYVRTLEDLFGFFVKFCEEIVKRPTNVKQLEREKGQRDVPEIQWITKYFDDLVVGGSDRFAMALNAANFLAVNIYVNYGISYIFTKLITSRTPRSFCRDLNVPYSFGCTTAELSSDDEYDERWDEIFRGYVTQKLNEPDDEDDEILAKFEAECRQKAVNNRIMTESGDKGNVATQILSHRGVSFGQRAGTSKNSFAPISSKNDADDDWLTKASTSAKNIHRSAVTASGKLQTQRQERNARRNLEAAASPPMYGGPAHNRVSITTCSYGRNRNVTDDGVGKSFDHDRNRHGKDYSSRDPQLTSAVPQQLSKSRLVNAKPLQMLVNVDRPIQTINCELEKKSIRKEKNLPTDQLNNFDELNASSFIASKKIFEPPNVNVTRQYSVVPQRSKNEIIEYGKPPSYLCGGRLTNARSQQLSATLHSAQSPSCSFSDSSKNGFDSNISKIHAPTNLHSAHAYIDCSSNNRCESTRRTRIQETYRPPGARAIVATQHQQSQYTATRKDPPRPLGDDKIQRKKLSRGRMRAFSDDDDDEFVERVDVKNGSSLKPPLENSYCSSVKTTKTSEGTEI